MRPVRYPLSAQRLEQKMKEKDIRANELAVDTGISPAMISLYKSGRTRPSKERAELLGRVLGCSGAWLLGYDVLQEESPAENVFTIERKHVPLLGSIACGEPKYAEQDFEAYVMVGADVPADFCVRASGDSMTGARIQDGDIVFIRQTPMVENGKIAAVVVNDDTEATLKRFYLYRDKELCILKPENPAYKDIILSGRELDSVRILGEAVAFQSDIR